MTRVYYLDGLRGWAALSVFYYHLVERFLGKAEPVFTPKPFDFLFDGPFAVMIFFVISGYALSTGNLDNTKKALAITAVSRYFRLAIPIVITSFFGYSLLKYDLMYNLQVQIQTGLSSKWLITHFTFDESFYGFLKDSLYNTFHSFTAATSYNSSLWTIRYEWLGSLIIYSYLAIFRKDLNVQWLIAITILIILLNEAPIFSCFIGGYLIAELKNSYPSILKTPRLVQILSTTCFILIIITFTYWRPYNTTIICAAAILFVASISFSKPLQCFFSMRLSRFLGKISFPLYLIHIFVICSWSSYLFIFLSFMEIEPIIAISINIISSTFITLAIAISLLPIEKFSVKSSKVIGNFIISNRRQHY